MVAESGRPPVWEIHDFPTAKAPAGRAKFRRNGGPIPTIFLFLIPARSSRSPRAPHTDEAWNAPIDPPVSESFSGRSLGGPSDMAMFRVTAIGCRLESKAILGSFISCYRKPPKCVWRSQKIPIQKTQIHRHVRPARYPISGLKRDGGASFEIVGPLSSNERGLGTAKGNGEELFHGRPPPGPDAT